MAKEWLKEPITAHGGGCLCCAGTTDKLPMNTRIYDGFGGYTIWRNGQLFYAPPNGLEFDEYDTLMKYENKARKEPDADWQVKIDLPLRNATYQRHDKNTWVLIEQGQGFA